MAELLALRSCSSRLLLSYNRNSTSFGCSYSNSRAVGWSKYQSQQVSFRQQNHLILRLSEKGSSGVRAEVGDANGKNEPSQMSAPSEDWQYFGKIFAACSVGAVLVKYGSVLVPSITQPNLVQALIIITTPVLVSVLVLIIASAGKMPDK